MGDWASKLAANQREGAKSMTVQYRCERCNSVEHGTPHNICNHCSQDFMRLHELADKLRARFGLWDLSHFTVIRTVMNRLIAKLNGG